MRVSLGWMVATVLGLVGCDAGVATPPSRPTAAATATAPEAAVPFRETWEAHYIQGTKIGYVHTAYRKATLDGRDCTVIESIGKLTIERFGQTLEQSMRERSWETPTDNVLRFESFAMLGNSPQVTTGVVSGNSATLTLQTAGTTTTQAIAWPAGTRYSTGVVDSLRSNPMKFHATRTLTVFLPVFNRVATIELRSQTFEDVKIDGQQKQLLRIDAKAVIAGSPAIESVMWVDADGETWKTAIPALQQTAVRTTAAKATGTEAGPKIDIGTSTLVHVEPPLADAHRSEAVRYRVQLTGGDAAAVFPNGEGHVVRKLDDGAAEIVVTAVRPTTPLPPDFRPTPPSDRERRPSSVVQSDDEAVRRLAAEVMGDANDAWQSACATEGFVHRKLRSVEFSQAFATAAETARSLTGDCTEHAVLLCAVLRAKGIPARAAIGLVYVESQHAFGYHMWTEAWIGDRWIPLDATVGRGGTSAAYLKLADSHLDGVDSYTALLPVFSILGRLKVSVIEQR